MKLLLTALPLFLLTALAEIGGCYAVYAWLRLGRSTWWLAPGLASLFLFAWLLTLHPPLAAGRVYAAYGGIYVATSLLWLWLAEGARPSAWDLAGATLAILGTLVIVLGPRWT